jgi:hypothetical protein
VFQAEASHPTSAIPSKNQQVVRFGPTGRLLAVWSRYDYVYHEIDTFGRRQQILAAGHRTDTPKSGL